jgi:hypothetical protein
MRTVASLTEREPAAPESNPAATRPRLDPWVLRLAIALTLAPLVVSAINLSVRYGNGHQPVGDLAMTELVTRDVGRQAVLIGPFSRDGWHHPGPAMYYLLAVPYRLLGSTATAMHVGALAVNAASIAGIAVVARRRAGDALMLISLVGCALLMRSLGPDELRLPWNPYVTVLPYALLVFLTWALMCRDRWALPLAVLVASYVAQTHIGYVLLALPLLVVGAAWLVGSTAVDARRGAPDASRDDASAPAVRSLVAPSLTAVAVAVVMWLPPLLQQLTNEPGNLGIALKWFRYGGLGNEAPQGLLPGWRVVTAQFGLPPEWLFGSRGVGFTSEPVYLHEPMAPVLLLAVAGAALLLLRCRPAGAGRLVGLWLLASVAGVVATARTVGPVYGYRIGWSLVLGMVAGLLVAWAGWLAVTARRPRLERPVLVPVSLVGLALLAVVGSVAHVRAGEPLGDQSTRVGEIMADVVGGLPRGDGDVLVDGPPSFEGAVYVPAIVLQLERRGIGGLVAEGDRAAGEHRMYDGRALRAHLLVAVGVDIAEVEAQPGMTMLAYTGDATLAEVRAHAAEGTPAPPGSGLAVFLVAPAPAGSPGET